MAIKDFSSTSVTPIEFIVNGDTFQAAGECPGGTIADMAAVADSEDAAEQLQAAMAFFDQVLLPESADLFADRLRNPQKPISIQKAMEVFTWLVEQYTGFPTQAQPSSPPGSPEIAKSSVARSSASRATTRSPKVTRSAAV